MQKIANYINGKLVEPHSGKYIDNYKNDDLVKYFADQKNITIAQI